HRSRVSEIGIIDISADPAKAMPIEQIQQLASELKSHLFGDPVRFRQRKILADGSEAAYVSVLFRSRAQLQRRRSAETLTVQVEIVRRPRTRQLELGLVEFGPHELAWGHVGPIGRAVPSGGQRGRPAELNGYATVVVQNCSGRPAA